MLGTQGRAGIVAAAKDTSATGADGELRRRSRSRYRGTRMDLQGAGKSLRARNMRF